jgi:hypothetical protein
MTGKGNERKHPVPEEVAACSEQARFARNLAIFAAVPTFFT